jgi:hypothetical protein
MKKIILKIEKNKVYPAKLKRSRGFVILFAVTLAAIFLSIALGVADISLKEINFGTSAKDTENSFNAAEVGTECAEFYDNPYDLTVSAFNATPIPMNCAGKSVAVSPNTPSSNNWTFYVTGLNSDGYGCAIVTVNKDTNIADPNNLVSLASSLGSVKPFTSYIISNGYNKGGGVAGTCSKPSGVIEREIDTPTY